MITKNSFNIHDTDSVLGANLHFSEIFNTGFYSNLRISNLLNKEIHYPVLTEQAWAVNGTIADMRSFYFTLGFRF